MGKIPGTTLPNEWIVRGNHHDAWVNGAADPVSGTAPLLEEARAFGELLKQGWKPKRTIVYTVWDGEEPMLLGSTEWVEQHDAELREKAAIYINSDGNGRGFLGASGSHTLEKFINGVAKDIEDPETKLTAWKRLQALLKQEQDRITERNAEIEEGVFAAVNDPRHPLLPPKVEAVPPSINFAPLENAAASLTKAADRYRRAAEAARSKLGMSPMTAA